MITESWIQISDTIRGQTVDWTILSISSVAKGARLTFHLMKNEIRGWGGSSADFLDRKIIEKELVAVDAQAVQ